jgi:rare lipoprotein A (peptidoglycan hydrolase)
MRAISESIMIFLVFLISISLVSCASERAVIKQDHRNVKAAGDKVDSDYNEENYDFDDSRGGSKLSTKKKTGSAVELSTVQDESAYKKDKYYQTGMASWYGREFNGKKTASGEKFDMNDLTAAHKSLPMGTVVEVKNFDTGKTVSVRINDRGPYHGNRIIDLSYGAAKKIGMLKNGKSNVGIRIVKKTAGGDVVQPDENNLEAVSDDVLDEKSAPSGNYAIQAGAFYSRKNAENLKAKIEGVTDKSVVIIHDNDLYKVHVRGISSMQDLKKLKKALSNEDIPSFRINRAE